MTKMAGLPSCHCPRSHASGLKWLFPGQTVHPLGPRTMEHLDTYLAADGIELPAGVLDRTDQIVPLAATVNVAEVYHRYMPGIFSP